MCDTCMTFPFHPSLTLPRAWCSLWPGITNSQSHVTDVLSCVAAVSAWRRWPLKTTDDVCCMCVASNRHTRIKNDGCFLESWRRPSYDILGWMQWSASAVWLKQSFKKWQLSTLSLCPHSHIKPIADSSTASDRSIQKKMANSML